MTFPEVLKVAAEDAATESDDGVGAKHGPVHSGTFGTGSDGDFAASFDNAGRIAEIHLPKTGIALPSLF